MFFLILWRDLNYITQNTKKGSATFGDIENYGDVDMIIGQY